MKATITALAALIVLAMAGAGCGQGEPRSAVTKHELETSLKGSPAPLRELHARSSEVIDGSPAAFRRQIQALRGYPVVINKWAAWCGPCRLEFPFFQRLARKYGKRIAFLGVDSLDSRKDAQDFLEKLPVPYPSFFDPKGKVAVVFRGDRVFPASAFYDSKGALVYTKQGPYHSQRDLAVDIRRYAR